MDETKKAYWEIVTAPVQFQADRIHNIDLQKYIDAATVRLRGWYFPHIDHQGLSHIKDGVMSTTNGMNHRESFTLLESGLFVFRRYLWEDHHPDYTPHHINGLEFINTIWSMTEFFLFFERLYEQVNNEEGINIEVRLHNIQGRELYTLSPRINFSPGYVCDVENGFTYKVQVSPAMLNVNYLDFASDILIKLFQLFGWSPEKRMIREWQDKLINKTYY